MTGEELLEEVRSLLNDPTWAEFDEINRAYRQICRLTRWNWLRTKSTDMVSFQADVVAYPLDLGRIRVLEAVWVQKVTGNQEFVLMEEAPVQLFEAKVLENRNPDGSQDSSRPRWYKLESNTLTVTPIPDQTYTVRLDFIEHIQEIGLETDIRIKAGYEDVLAMLAAGRILTRPGTTEAQQLKGQAYVAEATSEFDGLVAASFPNRTKNIDRTPQTWLR